MKYAPRSSARAFERGVKQQRTQNQRSSESNGNRAFTSLGTEVPDAPARETAGAVRAWHYSECSIVGWARIHVNPHREQSLENARWWLYVEPPFLLRPAAAFGRVDSLCHRNAEVLVERDEPIALG